MTIKYAVIAKWKHRSEGWEPLAYGRPSEPAPDLLLKRSRVTLFSTEQDAMDALAHTCRISKDDPWVRKTEFAVIEAEEV